MTVTLADVDRWLQVDLERAAEQVARLEAGYRLERLEWELEEQEQTDRAGRAYQATLQRLGVVCW